MLSFLVQLQTWGLSFTKKRPHLRCLFVKFMKSYRISFLQKTPAIASDFQHHFGHITSSINTKLSLSRSSTKSYIPKQFTVFVSKIFKITKVEGNIFCGWGQRNEKNRVFSRSSHPQVFCKNNVLKYLVKLTGKHLCRSFSLACKCETLVKKRLLLDVFLSNSSEPLFHRTPVNSLTTLTIIFNFVENIWNLVHEAIWKCI